MQIQSICFFISQLRQISYEYNNCANDGWLKEMGRTYLYSQRQININNYHLQTKECGKIYDWRNSATNKCPPFERTSFFGLDNSSKYHLNTVKSKLRSNEYCEKVPTPYDQTYARTPNTVSGLPTSILDTKNDLRSSENIFNDWKEIHCKMINLSKKLRSRIFQDPILEKVSIVIYHLS